MMIVAFVLASCHPTWQATQTSGSQYDIVDTARDADIADIISPYRDSMSQQMDEVIAVAATDLVKQQPESPLGNLVAEIIFESATESLGKQPDFSIQNYGGLRIPKLAQGDITRGRVYELMPFENYIVVMHLEGSITLQLINHMAVKGGWPVHGLRFEIANGQAQGIEIAGKPFQSRQSYSVALPDYLANGGDDCSFLKDQPRQETQILIREAILSYMSQVEQQGGTITSQTDGRVRHVD